ncbi:GNAT family N-acetyltransferase [Mucilaginibacter ginsenosidivorax]|uniref:GNAT family N-acetyltransferase n=1 Tax=Mucilaginibacter ginsenosidivorax TaxID=862126 RepID=A0A5B8VZI8_9SPHI|nr:GNAT family protein [Mucilaginibacter ginsenosidivorax]QEC76934.1 GNAT family N-acetyltransferase [Mucilaginibacter ginsenosidivorax]
MEIKSDGFILRELRLADAESLQKHADNPRIFDALLDRFPSPYTMADAVDFIGLAMAENVQTKFAIVINGEVAGVIGIDLRGDIYRKSALIGYWLGQDHWGKGIMPKAVKLVVNYGFANLDIVRLQAGVLGNNPKSMRVLEKAGFVKEAICKNAIIKNGLIFDEHLYATLKPSA